jgi:hypothetical protein
MKAFLVREENGNFRDIAIRSSDLKEAQKLAGANTQVGEIREDVARAMDIPDVSGIHEGALSRWIWSPTNLFGEIQK